MEVLIGDSQGSHLLIKALSRSLPDCKDFWDGNWIDGEVSLRVGGFRGHYSLNLRAEDFQIFREEVQRLSQSLQGKANFQTREQQLVFFLLGDGKGHLQVEGVAIDQLGDGNRLQFNFGIDQTYLPAILQSLEEISRRLPVRNAPKN